MNASQRRRYSRKVEKINRALEDPWTRRITKAIQHKANIVIARLKSGGTSSAFSYISTDLANEELAAQVKKLYRHIGLIHAKRINDELRSEPKVLKNHANVYQIKRLGYNDQWAGVVNDYLEKFLFEKITFEVNSTTRDALMRAVQRGVKEGLGVDDIIRILENWPYARFQAARIVRTEIHRAAEVGAEAGGSTFQYEQQGEWIAAKDSRTRGNPMNGQKDHANHWALDGVVINDGDVFTDPRNGDKLRFPGDPEASAKSTIFCRCTKARTAKRDERGRLIPKATNRVAVTI